MTAAKWRITKSRGMWVVRRPSGAHFGAYSTWKAALTTATCLSHAEAVRHNRLHPRETT